MKRVKADDQNRPVPQQVTYYNLERLEGDPFHEYGFTLRNITRTRSDPVYMDEMRIAQRGTEFSIAMDTPLPNEDPEEVRKRYETAIADFRNGAFDIISLNEHVNVDLEAAKRNMEAVNYSTPGELEFINSQSHILNYMGNGDWRTVKILEGDEIYLIGFGKDENFPLLWATVSLNKQRKYMRLHGWAKSLFSQIYYTAFDPQPIPQGVATFALSILSGIFGIERVYLTALPYTKALLKKILNTNNPVKRVRSILDTEQAAGEPEYFVVNSDLQQAHNPRNVEECILCGSKSAGFYFPHLGQATRFCGACPPPLASRTASAQGLLGQ